MSLGEYTPKPNQESDPTPPKRSVTKLRPISVETNLRPQATLDPIPVTENVVLSHPIAVKLSPSNVVVENVPANKCVLLFGVTNRSLAKAYKETGVRVYHLSLSEEEDTFIRSQGLGLSTFRASIGQSLNPTIADGCTGLVVLGGYVDKAATLEQRIALAKSIAPVVEE